MPGFKPTTDACAYHIGGECSYITATTTDNVMYYNTNNEWILRVRENISNNLVKYYNYSLSYKKTLGFGHNLIRQIFLIKDTNDY